MIKLSDNVIQCCSGAQCNEETVENIVWTRTPAVNNVTIKCPSEEPSVLGNRTSGKSTAVENFSNFLCKTPFPVKRTVDSSQSNNNHTKMHFFWFLMRVSCRLI